MKVYNHSHLIFGNTLKIYTGEKAASSTNGARKAGCPHEEE